jgi:shikimate kinase
MPFPGAVWATTSGPGPSLVGISDREVNLWWPDNEKPTNCC